MLVWDADDLEFICYRFGSNLVRTVIKKGRRVIGLDRTACISKNPERLRAIS